MSVTNNNIPDSRYHLHNQRIGSLLYNEDNNN